MLKKQPLQRLIMLGFILATASLHVQSSPELSSSLEPINSPELIKGPELINSLERNYSLERHYSPEFDSAPRDNKGRFTNQGGDISHGSLPVRLGFYLRRFGTLFRSDNGAPKSVANEGSFLRDNSTTPTVTWIGHATLLVQMEGVNFLTDPIWSQTPSPVPPIGPSRWVDPGWRSRICRLSTLW